MIRRSPKLTRRDFIRASAAAVLAASLLPRTALAQGSEEVEVPELPWPYTKLDPEETRRLGHLGYYLFECSGGAFWAVAVQLREKIGHPWTLLPIPSREQVLKAVKAGKHLHCLLQYGHGGAVSWGTLCGALNGSLAIIQMVIGEKKAWDKLGRALMRIYETTPLPTKKSNEMVVNGKALVPPERLKSKKWLPSNTANSTLCHVSVGKWCEVSGYASGSKERSERCGRLTGDIAAFAVMLLNAYFDAYNRVKDPVKAASAAVAEVEQIVKREYGGTTRLSATTASCRTCHYKGKVYEDGQFTRGFLECEACHRDMTPHAHSFFRPEAAQPAGAEVAAEKQLKKALLTGGVAGTVVGVAAGFATAKAASSEKNEEKS